MKYAPDGQPSDRVLFETSVVEDNGGVAGRRDLHQHQLEALREPLGDDLVENLE